MADDQKPAESPPDMSAEVAALKKERSALEAKLASLEKKPEPEPKKENIPQASESSVHALLERVKAIDARLDKMFGAKKTRWAPF